MLVANRNAKLGLIAIIGLGISVLGARTASATLIESFENTLDGWGVPSPAGNNASFAPVVGFSSTTGITEGTYSLQVTGNGTAGPDYGQLALSPSSTALTSILANSSSVSIDVLAPAGSFGFFLQFDIDIDNTDTGFVSLDGYSYQGTTIGAQTTITVPISPALNAALAASSNPTALVIQVGGGFSPGNETMYIDNVRTTDIAVPEPASLGLLSVCSVLLVKRRRR